MIPNERAERFGDNYLEDGKRVVMFNPKLTEEEWDYLMVCQDEAIASKAGEIQAKEKELIENAAEKKLERDAIDKAKKDKAKEKEKNVKENFNKTETE